MCLILLVVVRAAPGCFSWCKSQTMGTNSKNTLGKGAIAKEKAGQKNVWKFVPLRGGGGGPLMANAILNFHFDFLTTSLRRQAWLKSTLALSLYNNGSWSHCWIGLVGGSIVQFEQHLTLPCWFDPSLLNRQLEPAGGVGGGGAEWEQWWGHVPAPAVLH